MTRPRILDAVPLPVTGPSLIVTDPMPAYRAPRTDAPRVLRPFARGAGGSGVATDADAYRAAVTAGGPASSPGAPTSTSAIIGSSCGCGR